MSLTFRESDELIKSFIESGWSEMYDVIMSGAEIHTNCYEYAEEINAAFPDSTVYLEKPEIHHARKKKKRHKR